MTNEPTNLRPTHLCDPECGDETHPRDGRIVPIEVEEDVRGCSCGMADYGAPGHDGDGEEDDEDDEVDFSVAYQDLVTTQAWVPRSEVMLALEFIRDRHLEEPFLAFLTRQAEDENNA